MIVEIKVARLTLCAVPPKDQPPLAVNSDGMEHFQIAFQLFEMVAWWHAQVLVACCIVNHL